MSQIGIYFPLLFPLLVLVSGLQAVVQLVRMRRQHRRLRDALLRDPRIGELRSAVSAVRSVLIRAEQPRESVLHLDQVLAEVVGVENMLLDRPLDERIRYFSHLVAVESQPQAAPPPTMPAAS